MTTWRLDWKGPLPGGPHAWIDGSALRPDLLAPRRREEVLAAPVRTGTRLRTLGDIFEVTAADEEDDVPALVVAGSPRLLGLGHGMAAGRLEVLGHGGELCGSGLEGGEIRVRGDAGSGVGSGMTGGRITVEGDAGDRAGGASGNAATGLRGGEVVIHGNAGAEVGLRMRRGLIAIAGACGPLAGHHLLAGTIVVARGDLESPGLHLRRGSIVALEARVEAAVGFRREGPAYPGWLALLRSRLDELDFPWDRTARRRFEPDEPWLAWSGDELCGGRGELLVPARSA
jgi:formylmethanofuran dehydrogenase subunit C